MNLKDLWDYLHTKPTTKWRETIDELEARGEISALTANFAHSTLDDWANDAYKRKRENEF